MTTLQGASDRDTHRHAPLMPWMHLVNLYLGRLGFVPGQRVNITADYRSGNLTISPDHD
ncbi:type I toxin-antitoxin system SymE family toxin [Paraburkholderia caribensis]|uniref:type I toxin-antitoxin system SymE family toxin n=1 Tax=Paraburkholderia caribensis TaxID=75105 RepID=UPI0011E04042|nr:type I toxin-antitoxin system SymE family toxin [Paraburkholderia caribensis]